MARLRQEKKKMGDLGYFFGLFGGQYLRGAKPLELHGFGLLLGLFRY
jgi:hypothetical protein